MHAHKRESDEGEVEETTKVTEKSYLQLGLVVTIVGFVVGAIWWAATMSSKMEQVIEEVKGTRAIQTRVNDSDTKIKILELKIAQIETQSVETSKAAQAAALAATQAAQAAALAATQAAASHNK